jgi:hypothetical protein
MAASATSSPRGVIEAGGDQQILADTSLSMITDMLVSHPWIGRVRLARSTPDRVGGGTIRSASPDADGFKRMLLDARHEYELDVGGGHALQDWPAVVRRAPAAATAPPAAPARSSLSAEEVDSWSAGSTTCASAG